MRPLTANGRLHPPNGFLAFYFFVFYLFNLSAKSILVTRQHKSGSLDFRFVSLLPSGPDAMTDKHLANYF